LTADEAGTLVGFLEFQRATLEWKTRGLEEQGLRRRLDAHPSRLTLGGLLSHLAWVEDFYFSAGATGSPMPEEWQRSEDGSDFVRAWTSADTLPADEVRGRWERSVARSRSVVEDLIGRGPDALGRTYPAWDGQAQVTLRWLLTHMVEEYSRHNGHADLLRELVDGQTGE
jgi:uncharacterized damage-inducible protein DinB